MKQFLVVAALIVIASAALFAVRHQSLRQLRSEQEALRQRSEEAANLRANARTQAEAANSARAETALSAAERSELLRLRGQITRLRQDLKQEANQPPNISRGTETSGPTEEPVVTPEEAMARMNRGKQWMLALLFYAQKNQDRLPASLSDAASFEGAVEGDDSYELLQSGLSLKSLKAAGSTIVLREKRPWKGENGFWRRTYAFADGHTEIASSATPDFTEWEKSKAPPKQDTGQR